MRFGKMLVIAVASSSMVAAPVMANPAASLSVVNSSAVKAQSSGKNASNLTDRSSLLIVFLTAAAAAGGIWALADSNDNPDSN
jgi:hypothetical protein